MNITVQSINRSYGGNDVFTGFSLDVLDGMRLCVCGPNGSGKSTLIRIMAGVDAPDAGRVIVPKGCRVGYVEQMLGEDDLDNNLLAFVQEALPDWREFWAEWETAQAAQNQAALLTLTNRQHDLEIRYGYNPEQRAQAVLSGLGFSRDKWKLNLRHLSGGWRERAKLARVLTAGSDVLLLDEPTNHLDLDAVEWLESFLLEYSGALVFVAHDRVFMDRIGTHVLYLGAGKPLFRKSSFSKFLEMQEEIDEQRERDAKRLAEDLDRKMEFVSRFRYKASKARQAQSRIKMAKKLEKELEQRQPDARRKELAFKWPEAARSEKLVLSAAELQFCFPDGTSLWPALSFNLYRGQRVGLVGHNGTGKSTLLKILGGKLQRTGGQLSLSNLTRLGYYSQQQSETLGLNGTVLGEMRRLSDPRTTEEELMSVLGLFLLGQGYFDRQVATLSGGERSRLALAVLFLARCNLLVLDEPTNHLDLESRQALMDALNTFEGTLLLVAHDRYLLAEAVDEIWAMDERGLTIYENGFEEYDEARRAACGEKKKPDVATGLSREDLKRQKREQGEMRNILYQKLKPLQAKYAKQEAALEALLLRQAEVESQLALPEMYNDGQLASALLKEFHQLQTNSERLLEEMGELEATINDLEACRTAL